MVTTVACGGASKKAAGPGGKTGNEDLNLQPVDAKLCDTAGKKVALYDLNQDGKPDVWKLSADAIANRGEVITCKQVDLDHDGKKDFVTHYDEAGKVVLEEYDFDFDGKFDARIYFDARTGKRYAAERVSGYGDKPDIWEKYGPDEMLEALRRDRNGDGKPDYWEQYLGGVLDKILYDDDLDGVVDRKEEARAGQGSGISASVTPAPLDAPPVAPAPTPSVPAPVPAVKETSRPEPPMEPGEKEEPPAPGEEK